MSLQTIKRLIPEQSPLRLAWHKAKAYAAAMKYGFPAKKLTVIGVTGTDGKTTTVGMVAHILNANGIKVGALSTAFFQINDKVTWNATQKTSPSPFTIQKFLRQLVNEGCTHAVLEYSSHGLIQGRTLCTWPKVAAITNLSEEHLDYHGTMDEYLRAKSLLFRMLKKDGVKVLHASDRSFGVLRKIPSGKTIIYDAKETTDPADVKLWLSDIENKQHPTATVHLSSETRIASEEMELKIPGAFNLDNALCAIGCAVACGMEMGKVADALASFTGVPGRMERIDEGQDFGLYIDFTVTPQSYEATLSTLKAIVPAGKRLLVLTGSCGDRMKEKRPTVGKIVSTYADVMVVANEDPYTEDPEKIIDEVWAGVDQSHTQAHRIFDRRKAIEFLLHEAKSGDIVILCGKGSDTTMWVKEGQIPWNEREIAKEILKSI
jgi:UDP-N-acetylmuramoyl-L-alanyl-D-glutamate--2,6-diaminopimelate ligase